MAIITKIEKTCACCTVDRPLHDFHRNSKHPDGRQYYCKLCMRAYKRGYLAGINRERVIA